MQDLLVLRIHEPSGPRLVTLRAFPATLGRSVFGDVAIEVDGVSLRHAQIDRHPDGYLLRDVGSANGTVVGGVAVKEHLFRENGAAVLGGVRVDFVLRESTDKTRTLPLPVLAAEWGPKRVAQTVAAVAGLYLVICLVYAFKQFGDFWPPERPSEIFTESVGIFAGLAALSFFASLLSKLNTRRFRYLVLLTVVTAAVAWFLLLDEVGDALEYNLWHEGLRAVVPLALRLATAAVALTALMHLLFPGWRRGRLALATVLLVGGGYGLNAVKDHYRFEESDMRAAPMPLGLPFGDPAKGAGTTAELVAKLSGSIATVQEKQRRTREELDADEGAKGPD